MSWSLLIFGLLYSRTANAFDPTVTKAAQVAQVASAASGYGMAFQAAGGILGGSGGGLFGGGGGAVDEMVDVGFSLTELFNEVGIEPGANEALDQSIRELNEKNEQMRTIKWATEDLNRSLTSDLANANSLSSKLKVAKRAVEASRRLAAVMGVAPKSAERAAHLQEIRLNHLVLEELQGIHQTQMLAYLEEKKKKADREILLNQILQEETEGSRKELKRRKM